MADNALVRINAVTPTSGGFATITVKHLVGGNGDIDIMANGGGADVKFKLAGKAANDYSFKYPKGGSLGDHPICVFKMSASVNDCTMGVLPTTGGWKINKESGNSFELTVPQFPTTDIYKYKLFLTDTKSGGSIVVDPRIGCCEAYVPFWEKALDLLGLTPGEGLVLFGAACVALGIFPGHRLFRALAGLFKKR